MGAIVSVTNVSRLYYCNALDLDLQERVLHKLQLIKNVAARLLMGVPRRDPITLMLAALHWLPVKQWVLFKTGCLVY